MVAIVAALFDEVSELVNRLVIDKSSQPTHYRGKIGGVEVALLLVRPGFRKKKEFRRFMMSAPFERLINIGFAGALKPSLQLAEICPISKVIPQESLSAKTKGPPLLLGIPGAPESGFCIVEASKPVFSFDDKEELHLRSRADLVDMESAELLRQLALLKKEGLTLQPEIIKIVGDAMADEKFLEKEELMRPFFSTFGWSNQLKIALKTGPAFFPLYFRKRKLQRTLYSALLEVLLRTPPQETIR